MVMAVVVGALGNFFGLVGELRFDHLSTELDRKLICIYYGIKQSIIYIDIVYSPYLKV